MAVFRAEGAAGLSRWLRAEQRVQIDTTFRDAHQSRCWRPASAPPIQLAIAPATA
ncbi:MAG: hypothetical protein R3F60_16350 [bacterium]